MTRLWVGGVPVEVRLADGLPAQFTWGNRVHPVAGIANRWRVDIGWWRLRVWRDYFKLHTTTGLLLIVYHDLVSDQWYVQRVYD
jgi:hypothetical protein